MVREPSGEPCWGHVPPPRPGQLYQTWFGSHFSLLFSGSPEGSSVTRPNCDVVVTWGEGELLWRGTWGGGQGVEQAATVHSLQKHFSRRCPWTPCASRGVPGGNGAGAEPACSFTVGETGFNVSCQGPDFTNHQSQEAKPQPWLSRGDSQPLTPTSERINRFEGTEDSPLGRCGLVRV